MFLLQFFFLRVTTKMFNVFLKLKYLDSVERKNAKVRESETVRVCGMSSHLVFEIVMCCVMAFFFFC